VAAAGLEGPALVRQLIDEGKRREAVRQAQALHERQGSAESEALLVDAYLARLRGLGSNMAVEADTLVDLIARKHPCARPQLEALRPRLAARFGRFEELLRPLADPRLPEERRLAIEEAIRTEAADLAGLAACAALPGDHPLRGAARALALALERVTSGPVEQQELALPEVSRRNPLASFKLLVRALASFHRGDDAACLELCARLEPGSAPARLAPLLRALSSRAGEPLDEASRALAQRLRPDERALRHALVELDGALARRNGQQILRWVRSAVPTCRSLRPDLLDRLKQLIAIRCFPLGVPAPAVTQAMGGPSLHDVHFFRLLALVLEHSREPRHRVQACGAWEEFRRHAVHRGWFAPTSPETAAVYLHIASILSALLPEELEEARRRLTPRELTLADYYVDQPQEVRALAPPPGKPDLYFLDVQSVYRRAALCDPRPETFRAWLRWAKQDGDQRSLDAAARAWREACPRDKEPLLELVSRAEKRGALKQALGHLEDAEQLDALSPEVGRARFRLELASAIRHLKNRKPHLLEEDLGRLAARRELQQGDRRALIPALRWAAASVSGSDRGAGHRAELAALLPEEPAAFMLLDGLLRAAGHSRATPVAAPGLETLEPERATRAVARGCALVLDLALPASLPAAWPPVLDRQLQAKNAPPAAAVEELAFMLPLGRLALEVNNRLLAYAVSTRGLAHPRLAPGAIAGCFLLLRAQSLPDWAPDRIARCVQAARSIARRHRDAELLALVAESDLAELAAEDPDLESEELALVLREEAAETGYPDRSSRGALDPDDLCNCPACRRRRQAQRRKRPLQIELLDELLDGEDEIDPGEESDEDDAESRLPRGPELEAVLAALRNPELRRLMARQFAGAAGLPATLAESALQAMAEHGVLDPDVLALLAPELTSQLEAELAGPRDGRRRRRRGKR
jgi:hypothetical protein